MGDLNVFETEFINFKQAAAETPGRPHYLTFHRWATVGRAGVRLKSVLIGKERFTTRTWLNDFIAEVNRRIDSQSSPSRAAKKRKVTNVAKRSAAARKKLKKAGICK